MQRRLAYHWDVEIYLEAIQLSAEGVATRSNVHQIQCRLAFQPALGDTVGQQNRAGTGAPQRHAALRSLTDRVKQLVHHQQLADRRAFATRNNKTINELKMFRQPHLQCWRANAP
jgi:hypothetical protein